MKNQQGIGLLEVMVALMLLAVAVLGYAAMQVKANNVSLEAESQTRATELARDLHERMRINREGITRFENTPTVFTPPTATTSTTPTFPTACRTGDCTPDQLAQFDFETVGTYANQMAMSVAINPCQGTGADSRHCIYVSWGATTPTNGANADVDCTNGTVYHPKAQCVFMESFSYAR